MKSEQFCDPPVAFAGAVQPSSGVRLRIQGTPGERTESGDMALAGAGVRIRSHGDLTVAVAGRLLAPDGTAFADEHLRSAAHALTTVADPRRDLQVLLDAEGTWTLIAWNATTRRIAFCAAPLGGAELHWRTSGSAIVFGEEARDVLGLLDTQPSIDIDAVASWASTWCLPSDRTVFDGIRRLRGGAFWASGGPSDAQRRWYEPALPASDSMVLTMADAVELTAHEVDDAVARATVDLDHVGLALSGGVDSSMVAASLVRTVDPAMVSAFSNTFPGSSTADEGDLVQLTSEHLAIRSERVVHATVPVLLPSWEAATAIWKLPPGTPMIGVTHPMRRLAHTAGARHLLTGEGGDDLFESFPSRWVTDLIRRGRIPGAWSAAGRLPYRAGGIRTHLRTLREPMADALPPSVGRHLYRNTATDFGLLRADLRSAARATDDDTRPRHRGSDGLWWRRRAWAPQGIRFTADMDGIITRVSRLAGIEERHPFMHDRRLLESLIRIHPDVHSDPRIDRLVARNVLGQRLPEQVAYRTGKSHFTQVLVDSMLHRERAAFNDLLNGTPQLADFFDMKRVRAMTALGAETTHPHGTYVWLRGMQKIAAVAVWLRELER